jgi:hypothetical protein
MIGIIEVSPVFSYHLALRFSTIALSLKLQRWTIEVLEREIKEKVKIDND